MCHLGLITKLIKICYKNIIYGYHFINLTLLRHICYMLGYPQKNRSLQLNLPIARSRYPAQSIITEKVNYSNLEKERTFSLPDVRIG